MAPGILMSSTSGARIFTGAPLGRGRRRRFFFRSMVKKKRRENIFPTARFCFFLMGYSRFGGEREKVVGGYMAIRSRPEGPAIGRIFSDFPDFPENNF